jgi:branched-chain amino acid transport system ATP-binding protein
MAALLETTNLSVSFGGLRAVDGVDLAVAPGQIVGLIGPNGAGKTTFVDALTGFVPATGRIRFDGRDITKLRADRRVHSGLARTWQSLELFDDLTVAENLQVAAERASLAHVVADLFRPHRPRDSQAVDDALRLLDLTEIADRLPTELSHGQRKLVGVARALASRPKLVCMDEPAAGLDTSESEALGHRMRAMVDAGVTILLIDHDMGLVLSICDYVYVLEFGRLIAQGTRVEIRGNELVLSAYLGERARREVEVLP